MTHSSAATIFLIEGITVMSLSSLNTLKILSISNGPLVGIREITTTVKSNKFHQFLKYFALYTIIFRSASRVKRDIIIISIIASNHQNFVDITWEVSSHIMIQLKIINHITDLSNHLCSIKFLIVFIIFYLFIFINFTKSSFHFSVFI